MPFDPALVNLVMAALVGGLVLFASLLLFGTRLVRWLKLPQDLPEGPRFEPPPPPAVARGDRARAAQTAAAQARLAALYADAHAVVRAAAACQDLHHQVSTSGPQEQFVAAAAVTGRTSATAVNAANAVEMALMACDRRLRGDRAAVGDEELAALARTISGHALTAQGALAEARLAVAPLPDGGNRRLILLVLLLVVMIAWVVAMQTLLRR
jgi:hypothetical protein